MATAHCGALAGANAAVKLSRERLEGLAHVAVELAPGRGLRDPVSAAYARAGLERRVALTVSSFSVAAAVAATTDLGAALTATRRPRGTSRRLR